MTTNNLNILLIEDNAGDARLIREMLAEAGPGYSLEHSETLAAGLEKLSKRAFDAILLDIGLPDSAGLDSVAEIKKPAPRTPIVMLTGLDDEGVAISAMQRGVQDYLVKGKIDGGLLVRALRYAVERKRAEEEVEESHRLVRRIADATPDIIYIFDILEHDLVYVNAGLTRLLGYTQEYIRGLGESVYQELIHPEDLAKIDGIRRQDSIISKEDVMELGFRIKHADGEWRWFLSRNIAFSTTEDGRPKQLLGIIQDVTARRRMEEQLENYYKYLEATVNERTQELTETNELLESVFSNIYVLIAYMDRDFNFIRVNRKYAEADGRDPDFYVGKNHFDLFPNEENEAIFRNVVETGEPYFVYAKPFVYAEHPERGVTYWDWSLQPVKDARGQVQGLVLSLVDVTEKELLQAEAMRASQLASIGELAAGVAHEINNPVNGIINYAQMLINKLGSDTKEHEVAGRIVKEGDRITNIVSSLLSFSREGTGERESVKIQNVLQDTLYLTEAVMRKDGIRLTVDLPPDLPEARVNVQQIQQVFLNLISNARYALNEKYPSVDENKALEISGESVTDDGVRYLRMAFHDRGAGIPADLIDKVTNPFFTTKPRNKGTGLGLSISHGIINDHGGRIRIESVEGQFTNVVIELPA